MGAFEDAMTVVADDGTAPNRANVVGSGSGNSSTSSSSSSNSTSTSGGGSGSAEWIGGRSLEVHLKLAGYHMNLNWDVWWWGEHADHNVVVGLNLNDVWFFTPNGPWDQFSNGTMTILNSVLNSPGQTSQYSPHSLWYGAETIKELSAMLDAWQQNISGWADDVDSSNSDFQGTAAGVFKQTLMQFSNQIDAITTQMANPQVVNSLVQAGDTMTSVAQRLAGAFQAWHSDVTNMPSYIVQQVLTQVMSTATLHMSGTSLHVDTGFGDPASDDFWNKLETQAKENWVARLAPLDAAGSQFLTTLDGPYKSAINVIQPNFVPPPDLTPGGPNIGNDPNNINGNNINGGGPNDLNLTGGGPNNSNIGGGPNINGGDNGGALNTGGAGPGDVNVGGTGGDGGALNGGALNGGGAGPGDVNLASAGGGPDTGGALAGIGAGGGGPAALGSDLFNPGEDTIDGPNGAPLLGPNGQPLNVPPGSTIAPDGTVLGPDGQPIMGPNGQPLTVPPGSSLAQNVDGGLSSVGSGGGGLDTVTGPNGLPLTGANGAPITVPAGSTIGPNGTVLGPDGNPVLGPNGRPLTVPNGSSLVADDSGTGLFGPGGAAAGLGPLTGLGGGAKLTSDGFGALSPGSIGGGGGGSLSGFGGGGGALGSRFLNSASGLSERAQGLTEPGDSALSELQPAGDSSQLGAAENAAEESEMMGRVATVGGSGAGGEEPPIMPPMSGGGMGAAGGGAGTGGKKTWVTEDTESWGTVTTAGSGVIGR